MPTTIFAAVIIVFAAIAISGHITIHPAYLHVLWSKRYRISLPTCPSIQIIHSYLMKHPIPATLPVRTLLPYPLSFTPPTPHNTPATHTSTIQPIHLLTFPSLTPRQSQNLKSGPPSFLISCIPNSLPSRTRNAVLATKLSTYIPSGRKYWLFSFASKKLHLFQISTLTTHPIHSFALRY